GWDLRLARYVHLAMLALGSLALLLAARAVRGRSALSDTFLPLLVLTPWQYDTVLHFVYAYAMALTLMCLAVSAVLTGWALRSPGRSWLYLGPGLAIPFAGGPVGNLGAVGLCGVVLRGWLEGRPRVWKVNGLGGAALVAAASGTMLWLTPRYAAFESALSR